MNDLSGFVARQSCSGHGDSCYCFESPTEPKDLYGNVAKDAAQAPRLPQTWWGLRCNPTPKLTWTAEPRKRVSLINKNRTIGHVTSSLSHVIHQVNIAWLPGAVTWSQLVLGRVPMATAKGRKCLLSDMAVGWP